MVKAKYTMLLPFFFIVLALQCFDASSGDGESHDVMSEGAEFGIDDASQNRASDPRDHTAAGDIEEANKWTKPRADNRPGKEKFDEDHPLSDQLFEGCLLLDDKDKNLLSRQSDSRTEDKKTHISYSKKLWPTNVIPYDTTFTGTRKSNEEKFETAIRKAIKTLEEKTCLKFRRKNNNDWNWIEFYAASGCFSELGRKYWTKGATFISLGPLCWKEDVALHMILHALGFFHEQNRNDRDDFISINWSNIANGKSLIFHRHSLYNTDMYHKPQYDFDSIMHGQRNAFSKKPHLYTMQARHNPNRMLGGTQLSQLDIEKLQKMFCQGDPFPITPKIFEWTQWSSCSRSCGLGHRFRKEDCNGRPCQNAKYEMEACRLKKCIGSQFGTNFESGTGIWNVKEWYPSSCEWALMKSQGTKDHTTGIGSFVQADIRNSCKLGHAAYLTSDWLDKSNSKRCVTFYYTLSGKDVGDLSLYIVYKSGSQMMVWEREGDQGDEWKLGAASLPITDEKLRLKFIFRNGKAERSKVLLDDIYIDDGACLEGTQRCIDMDDRCKTWANNGECFKNPNYMMRKCCRACAESQCFDKDGRCKYKVARMRLSTPHCTQELWTECCGTCRDCLDWNPNCESWSKSGECDANPKWMRVNCKQSCGECMKALDVIQNR